MSEGLISNDSAPRSENTIQSRGLDATRADAKVMTGVFCHSAIQGSERDQELVVQAFLQDKQKYMKSVKDHFWMNLSNCFVSIG